MTMHDKLGQVRTGLDKTEQVWSTIFPQPHSSNLAHPKTCVQFPNHTFARNPTTLLRGGIRASSRFSWCKVWTGVKCNFSLPHHHVRTIVGKLSIRRVWMWNFTRIGRKTKKVMAFDNSGTNAVWPARLGTTPKRCELQLFFAGIRQAIWRYKAIHLRRLNMQFQQDWPKD